MAERTAGRSKAGVNYPSVTRLDSLDLLRGLCALAVAVFHFNSWGGIPFPEAFNGFLAVCGTYGVSVFFVLSGYSLAHGYGDRFAENISVEAILRYARRRIGRLMPLFSLVVLASILGKQLTGAEIPSLYVIIANLFLIFGFFDPAQTPVIGGWSIGIEVVFYVAFPLLVVMRRHALAIIATSIFLSSWITGLISAHGTLEAAWSEYVSPANHIIFFAAGTYAGFYLRRSHQWSLGKGRLALVCVVSMIVFVSIGADKLTVVTGLHRVLLVPLSILLVLVTSRISFHSKSVFAALFGAASYPLYLIHPLVYFFGAQFFPEPSLLFVALLFAALIFALLVDLLIDKPLQRRLKGMGW